MSRVANNADADVQPIENEDMEADDIFNVSCI